MGDVRVNTDADTPGTVTVRASGAIDTEAAAHLRHALVGTLSGTRPDRLVVDLAGVTDIDALTIGSLQAVSGAADDVDLPVRFHTAGSPIADHLADHGIVDTCR